MKPRYKTGDKVKLYKSIHPLDREYVGKLFTIKSYYEGCSGGNWYTVKENNIGYREDQLKKFAPSRTGKRDPKTGRFVSKGIDLGEGVTCSVCEKRLCACKYRLPNNGWDEEAEKKDKYTKNTDSKQRNYQKILRKLDVLEKKIDELGRRV